MNLYEQGQGRASRKVRLFWWIAGLFAVAFLVRICNPTTVVKENAIPSQVVSEDSRVKLALIINLHGQLCAKVYNVQRIRADVYEVSCTRYRDGTGNATYEVDPTTGSVK